MDFQTTLHNLITPRAHADGNYIFHYLDNACPRQKDTDVRKLGTVNNPGLGEEAPHAHELVLAGSAEPRTSREGVRQTQGLTPPRSGSIFSLLPNKVLGWTHFSAVHTLLLFGRRSSSAADSSVSSR